MKGMIIWLGIALCATQTALSNSFEHLENDESAPSIYGACVLYAPHRDKSCRENLTNEMCSQVGRSIGARPYFQPYRTCARMIPPPNGPSIGPEEGVSSRIMSSTQIVKPDGGRCGFNDAGVPAPAIYRRELRHYSEYHDGKLLRIWDATEDHFVECQHV